MVGRSVHVYVKTQTSCATILGFAGMNGGNKFTVQREHGVNAIDYCSPPGPTSIEVGRMISISTNESLRGLL